MKKIATVGQKKITFYVDDEFHRAFKAETARTGDSMQGVMLRLVRDWLGNRGALPQPVRKHLGK